MSDSERSLPEWAFESIEIVNWDPKWIQEGANEIAGLHHLLSAFEVRAIEHIGSTSIPGLPAKPIIDLMAIVPSYDCIDAIAVKLEEHNWHYVPPELDNRPWRRFFVKVKSQRRVAHLHAMLQDEPRWQQQLLFRERMKGDARLVEEYAALKRNLAERFSHDREAYSRAKANFIQRVLLSPPSLPGRE